ncbi:hypothetical protein TNIN_206501 [Trichonephila inaurata madagascariensis]|uniref:Uncharacterized protein n=1 Tax=Trichonephila inaurata madagascariensis TaxID=2747483 RepID=A0A8X7CC89_9ARAC|nr:hypothetical protein TNIN_206501 [Trichonephila inaurata madagascariensis]
MSHFFSLIRYICRFFRTVSGEETWVKMVASSEKRQTSTVGVAGKSWVYRLYSKGDSILPCGETEVIVGEGLDPGQQNFFEEFGKAGDEADGSIIQGELRILVFLWEKSYRTVLPDLRKVLEKEAFIEDLGELGNDVTDFTWGGERWNWCGVVPQEVTHCPVHFVDMVIIIGVLFSVNDSSRLSTKRSAFSFVQ